MTNEDIKKAHFSHINAIFEENDWAVAVQGMIDGLSSAILKYSENEQVAREVAAHIAGGVVKEVEKAAAAKE